MSTADPIRASFVQRFGEQQASAIEDAAQSHYAGNSMASIFGDPHGTDDFGSSPFRYWFLLAISYECLTRYSGDHGITAGEKTLRDWALHHGKLGEHDGDVPDYIGLMAGAYEGWIEVAS